MSVAERNTLHQWFQRIHNNVTDLESKIHQKQGLLFFKKHVYSQEDLLKSEIYNKIESNTRTIGDLLQSWANHRKLDKKTEYFYDQQREKVSSKMDCINQMIANREPTWWEQVEGFFIGCTKIILKNLPLIADLVIYIYPRLPGIPKLKLPPLRIPPRLPAAVNAVAELVQGAVSKNR